MVGEKERELINMTKVYIISKYTTEQMKVLLNKSIKAFGVDTITTEEVTKNKKVAK